MSTEAAKNIIGKDSLISNGNLLELVDGSETALHSHAGGGGGGAFTSRANAYLNNVQTITTDTPTVILFDVENWDNDSEFDIATNKGRFTAGAAGYYHVSAGMRISTMAAGKILYIFVTKNNSIISQNHRWTESRGVELIQISQDVYLNGSGDYVEIQVQHNSGGNETLSAGATSTQITIHRFA